MFGFGSKCASSIDGASGSLKGVEQTIRKRIEGFGLGKTLTIYYIS